MSSYKICIVNVYFGKYPNYMYLWLKSAAENPDIDFLLVTDSPIENCPKNVHCLLMTLEQFSQRASAATGLSFKLDRVYKCCDFKVAYGLIFQDELTDYDFWGHCDVDLVWGRLRHFITNDILDRYDKIYTLGHLSLFRNNERMNKAFMLPGSQKGDYKKIFTDITGNYAFDELGGIYKILEANNILQYEEYNFADISPVYKQMKVVKRYTDYGDNYKHQIFVYENGKIIRYYIDEKGKVNSDEFAYIHMQKRHFTDSSVVVDIEKPVLFTPKGFKNISKVTKTLIYHENRYRGRVVERLELAKRNYMLRKNNK